MERLIVDQDKCIGCGYCIGQREDYFEFDNNLAKVKREIINDIDKNELLTIVESCPTEAIVIENEG